MITTNTGAKKIEGTDNWRQIFDDHNDSVDAHDKTQSDLDYIINGNSSTVSIAAGKFVSVRGSTITGVTDGIYTAAKAIPASTTLDSSYFTAVSGGALNAISDQIVTIQNNKLDTRIDISSYISTYYTCPSDGYVYINNASGNTGVVFLYGSDGNTTNVVALGLVTGRHSMFVRKGMKLQFNGTSTSVYFVPLK